MIDATLYTLRPDGSLEVALTFHDNSDSGGEDDSVDYVSLVSNETYGPPALVAPARNGQGPRAAIEERVLYINTAFIPAWELVRISD
jgi:hypothetical protein